MYVDIMIRIGIVRARGKCVKPVTVIAALFLQDQTKNAGALSSPGIHYSIMNPIYFFASAQLLTSSS